jgi:transcriptional regulator with XRE-family HTH domain
LYIEGEQRGNKMNNYNQKIGAYLAKQRRAKKITQKQLADQLGVTKAAVSNWERGKRTIYADQMLECCDRLGLDPQELIRSVVGE